MTSGLSLTKQHFSVITNGMDGNYVVSADIDVEGKLVSDYHPADGPCFPEIPF